eukprot:scaffold25263_cov107-Isochrysis_galbana.AAC.1
MGTRAQLRVSHLLGARVRVGDIAAGGEPRFGHVRSHILSIAKLVAHGAGGFLQVWAAAVARGLIEVSDGGPATGAGAVVADRLFGQVDVAERHLQYKVCVAGRRWCMDSGGACMAWAMYRGVCGAWCRAMAVCNAWRHLCVVRKRLRDGVPRRRLLPSSASAFRRDPAHKQRAAGVDLALDETLKHARRALGHHVEMSVGVDRAEKGHAQRDQRHGQGPRREQGRAPAAWRRSATAAAERGPGLI